MPKIFKLRPLKEEDVKNILRKKKGNDKQKKQQDKLLWMKKKFRILFLKLMKTNVLLHNDQACDIIT